MKPLHFCFYISLLLVTACTQPEYYAEGLCIKDKNNHPLKQILVASVDSAHVFAAILEPAAQASEDEFCITKDFDISTYNVTSYDGNKADIEKMFKVPGAKYVITMVYDDEEFQMFSYTDGQSKLIAFQNVVAK